MEKQQYEDSQFSQLLSSSWHPWMPHFYNCKKKLKLVAIAASWPRQVQTTSTKMFTNVKFYLQRASWPPWMPLPHDLLLQTLSDSPIIRTMARLRAMVMVMTIMMVILMMMMPCGHAVQIFISTHTFNVGQVGNLMLCLEMSMFHHLTFLLYFCAVKKRVKVLIEYLMFHWIFPIEYKFEFWAFEVGLNYEGLPFGPAAQYDLGV